MLMFLPGISWAQCDACDPDLTCTSTDGFPTICPEFLPDGVAGEDYEVVMTFYLPENVTDPGSGISATLNSVTVTGISGLPSGLEVTLSDSDGVYEPPSGQTMGCATICGVPVWPGDFVITIQISALASAFGIEQQVNESFTYDLHIESGANGASSFVADELSGCGALSAVFTSNILGEGTQQTTWGWEFEGASAFSELGAGVATSEWDEPGSYTVSVTTTVSDLVLTGLAVTSGASNGGWDDVFTAPDLFFVISSASGPVFTSWAVIDNSTPTWSGLSVPLTNPPYTIQFYDEDNPPFGNDAMGSFDLSPTAPGTQGFSANPTYGELTIGVQPAFSVSDSMEVYVFPAPASEGAESTEEGLVVLGDSLGWEVSWWLDGQPVGSGSPWWPELNGYYWPEISNAFGCGLTLDSILWCNPDAMLEVLISDSVASELTVQSGFELYAWTLPQGTWEDSLGVPLLAEESGWYALSAQDGWGCWAHSDSLLVCLALPPPLLNQMPSGQLQTGEGYATYSWWWEGAELPGEFGPEIMPLGPGMFQVAVTDHGDCPAVFSAEWMVLGMLDGQKKDWEVLGNPFRNELMIRGPEGSASWQLRAFDLNGRIADVADGQGNAQVDLLRHAPPGVYLISGPQGMIGRVLKVH